MIYPQNRNNLSFMENEETRDVDSTTTSDDNTTNELAEKLAKLEAENGSLKRDLKKATKTVETVATNVDAEITRRVEKIELKAEGYTDEQVEEILSLGGKKILEKETIRQAFELAKKQSQTEKAADIASSGSFGESGFTKEEISKMSSQEYLEKVIQKK